MSLSKKPKKRDVIFIGAGGVRDAGLPLAQDLMSAIRQYEFIMPQNKDFAISVADELIKIQGFFHKIIYDKSNLVPNEDIDVERLFTLIDSFLIGKPDDITLSVEIDGKQETKKHTEEEMLGQSQAANHQKQTLREFKELLHHYFGSKYIDMEWDIKDGSSCENYLYLREMIDACSSIITTNWDLVFELLVNTQYVNQSKINYGLDDGHNDELTLLKLHGSVAWLENKNGDIQHSRKFSSLLYGISEQIAKSDLTDDEISKRQGTSGLTKEAIKAIFEDGLNETEAEQIFITPSYVKIIDNPSLVKIWSTAMQKLQNAQSVDIVGYSLPKADQAARVLLMALRKKNKDVRIVEYVKDKNQNEQDKIKQKWNSFFDQECQYCFCGAKNFYTNNCSCKESGELL